ncbi:UNVERIFIED_ORG: hypothetical protein ABIB52_003217 [Arthrobacter sp. UYCu721]
MNPGLGSPDSSDFVLRRTTESCKLTTDPQEQMLPPIQPAGHYGLPPPHQRMPGNPSGTTAFRLPGRARPRKPVPAQSPGIPPRKRPP